MLDDIKPPVGGEDTSSEASPIHKKGDDTTLMPNDKQIKAKTPQQKKWWHIFSYRHTHLSNLQWALLMLGMLILIVASAFGVYKLYKHITYQTPQQKQQAAAKKELPKPTTEPSRLTGLQVDPQINKRPVTGVMIENSPDARPQSGLNDAGLVFEAIAEGGITRFLALFQDTGPDYIGPVRSARPYYLDWVLTFDASLAHVGGSPDALGQIKSEGVRDLDQFANSGAYQRISSRYAPHNVYTSTTALDGLNQQKGFTSSSFTSWDRKPDQKLPTPTAKSIDFAVSGYLYSPHYDYDAASNSYLRSEGGQPHKDDRSGQQINPKVVIALVLNYSVAGDGIHSIYQTTGSGHMYVFQDGFVTEGTWQKNDRKSQYTFTDASGKPIKFNAGKTWVTMVNSNGAVTYK